jgi:hypothetical protein
LSWVEIVSFTLAGSGTATIVVLAGVFLYGWVKR